MRAVPRIAAASTPTWREVLSIDFATIDAHDLTDNVAHDVGIDCILPSGRGPGTGGVCRFNGSTGLEITTDNRVISTANNAPIVLFKAADAFPDFDPDNEATVFQWHCSSASMGNNDYMGGLIAENATPTDAQLAVVVAGQYVGNPYWGLREGSTTRAPSVAPAAAEQTFGEIILLPGNINLIRTGLWAGSWPDPMTLAKQAHATRSPVGADVNALNAVTVYTASGTHFGLSSQRGASGTHAALFHGVRFLRLQSTV